jgi:hypothetical protein
MVMCYTAGGRTWLVCLCALQLSLQADSRGLTLSSARTHAACMDRPLEPLPISKHPKHGVSSAVHCLEAVRALMGVSRVRRVGRNKDLLESRLWLKWTIEHTTKEKCRHCAVALLGCQFYCWTQISRR